MKENTIFVYEDKNSAERNSYGCFLVKPEAGGETKFLCTEWMWVWPSRETAGDPDSAATGSMIGMRPASYDEIVAEGLDRIVDNVLFMDDNFVTASRSVKFESYVPDQVV